MRKYRTKTRLRNCGVEGCQLKYRCKGYCSIHYRRWLKDGEAGQVERQWTCYSLSRPDQLRELLFKHRKITDNGCWEWTRGGKDGGGYGQQFVDKKMMKVHRLSKYLFHGFDFNSDLCILHRCDNPSCFNPDHLFVGTYKDNNHDRAVKGRSNNPKGAKHYLSKITEDDVRNIRELYKTLSQEAISRLFGISQVNVSLILRKKAWKHVI